MSGTKRGEYRMRTVAKIVLTVIFSACLLGCAASDPAAPVSDGAFSCAVEGKICGENMAARVWISALSETDEGREREVRMLFSAPEMLAGVEVSCRLLTDTHRVETALVSCETLHMSKSGLTGFLTPALLLAARFDETAVKTEGKGNRKVTIMQSEAFGNTRLLELQNGEICRLYGTFGNAWGEWYVKDLS